MLQERVGLQQTLIKDSEEVANAIIVPGDGYSDRKWSVRPKILPRLKPDTIRRDRPRSGEYVMIRK
jgi:hypothetical protein